MKPVKLNKIETVSFTKLNASKSNFFEDIYNKSKTKLYFWFFLFVSACILHTFFQFKVRDTEFELNKLKSRTIRLKSDYNALIVEIENLKRPSLVKEYAKRELKLVESQPFEAKELVIPANVIAKYENNSLYKQEEKSSRGNIDLALTDKYINKIGKIIYESEAKEIKK